MARKPDYITVWGDTVEFRDLVLGIVAGAVFSFIGSYYGKKYVSFHLSHTSAGLAKGYALLIGIVVSLLVAAVVALVYKPKRIFNEQETQLDRDAFVEQYHLDLAKEAECLKTTSADTLSEMKELGLYAVFKGEELKSESQSISK